MRSNLKGVLSLSHPMRIAAKKPRRPARGITGRVTLTEERLTAFRAESLPDGGTAMAGCGKVKTGAVPSQGCQRVLLRIDVEW